jgi:type IV secretory pathway TrbD component
MGADGGCDCLEGAVCAIAGTSLKVWKADGIGRWSEAGIGNCC